MPSSMLSSMLSHAHHILDAEIVFMLSGCGVPCQLRGENASFPFLIPVILFKLYRPSQVLSG